MKSSRPIEWLESQWHWHIQGTSNIKQLASANRARVKENGNIFQTLNIEKSSSVNSKGIEQTFTALSVSPKGIAKSRPARPKGQ